MKIDWGLILFCLGIIALIVFLVWVGNIILGNTPVYFVKAI